jgi:hypothetical protein
VYISSLNVALIMPFVAMFASCAFGMVLITVGWTVSFSARDDRELEREEEMLEEDELLLLEEDRFEEDELLLVEDVDELVGIIPIWY